ncbi:MAG: bifunctional enoyl-CoA hydratase/phosphate acetyltransferase [Hyphomicrobiales bacterium]
MTAAVQFIENRIFDDIAIGDTAQLARSLSHEDIELFAILSGDVNPSHLDAEYAKDAPYHHVIAHGMWGGSLISAVLGTKLPGPGTIYVDQTLHFKGPVALGDTVTARVRVREKHEETKHVVLDCECVNQMGETVIAGIAEVIAPTQKVRRPRSLLPDVLLHEPGRRYRELIERAHGLAPIRTAVVHPCDGVSLAGAIEARDAGLIALVLVGPRPKIEKAATEAKLSLEGIEIVDVPHSHAAASEAVRLARGRQVEALMKGSLHTEELMAAAVESECGLRTGRRMSHVFALDVPHYRKPLFITDAAVNIEPTLDEKRDIVQNAIDLCRALGIETPKVAILSAVETVSAKMKSTIDAAALCKMAERGQIEGGILDGPLAFDNAVSKEAAKTKHLVSDVAGDADILVAPNLETGNMLAKQLIYLADADAAGLVLGALVPIMLTSRADSALARRASCALAQLFVHRRTPARS